VEWHYVDATPASCVKFGLNTMFLGNYPDVVVSGINHGSNAATASCYSGTLGAAAEAALNGIPAIGVSLDTLHPDADFSAVEKYFGDIFQKLMAELPQKHGIYYNVNFPDIPAEEIKGVKVGNQGRGRWVREFKEWDARHYAKYGLTPEMLGQSSNPVLEEGEDLYMMVGDFEDDATNTPEADHLLVANGYISVVAHNIDCTDYCETDRLNTIFK
jgi:5'-nucleotidase